MTQTMKGDQAKPAKPDPGGKSGSRHASKPNGQMPGWTNGLRQLYDQVVEEDLPDSFRDLLARLDDAN